MTDFAISLDQLIDRVEELDEAPLDRVSRAVRIADDLGSTADQLVTHFVTAARSAGVSWAAIGTSLGVTKQAAQQRYVARTQPGAGSAGFSRFTTAARSVVVGAQEQARAARNDRITVGHLLLALLADPQGETARALAEQGATVAEAVRIATATLPAATDALPALIPFDSDTKATLERAFAEADVAGLAEVDPTHLLLALLAVEDGTGVLAGLGVRADSVRAGRRD